MRRLDTLKSGLHQAPRTGSRGPPRSGELAFAAISYPSRTAGVGRAQDGKFTANASSPLRSISPPNIATVRCNPHGFSDPRTTAPTACPQGLSPSSSTPRPSSPPRQTAHLPCFAKVSGAPGTGTALPWRGYGGYGECMVLVPCASFVHPLYMHYRHCALSGVCAWPPALVWPQRWHCYRCQPLPNHSLAAACRQRRANWPGGYRVS